VFENLVYLKIKHKNPCYFYKNGVEIDFFTEANTLIETKYNSALLGKQKKVFDSTSAEKKLVIKNVQNFMELS